MEVGFFAGGLAGAGLFLWSCFGVLGDGVSAVVLLFGWKSGGRPSEGVPPVRWVAWRAERNK